MVVATEERPKVTKQSKEEDSERLARFKQQLADDADTSEVQREKANEDMRFIHADGGMWEDYLEDEFENRVKLQFDITSPYKNRFIGEYNLNRVGVEYKPDEDSVTDDDAELLTGIRSADFRQFFGKMAQDNAVDELATCGRGDYKIATRFEDEGDPENDNQRIVYRTIHEGYNAVIWDKSAKTITKQDARWCHELTQFTDSSFKDEFPDFKPVSAYTPENYRSTSWLQGQEDIIYVATRYEVIRKRVTVFVYRNLESGEMETYFKEDHEQIKDELQADEFREFVRERKVIRQHVEKTVFSGDAILQETKRIPGKWIPIITMYGYRGFVDGVEWYKGLVRGLKDPQRVFNTQISQITENAASRGQDVPIFDPKQMLGDIANHWADMNNKAFMLADSLTDDDGKIVHTGPVGYVKPSQLDQSTAALMQIVTDYVQQATGGAPQDTLDPDASGKAIQALLKRENLNTQDMMDNIANAIEWEGVVYQSIASEIYNTPRIMTTLGKDGTEGKAKLLELVLDEETGKLVESNTISGKRFRAYADIGPQYDTQREQMVEELKGMLEALSKTEAGSKYTPAVIAMILQNVSGPGLEPLKKLVKQDMMLQGLAKPETDEEKQFIAQAQQPKEDPQAKLIEALAIRETSEARERDSKTILNTANANKAIAQIQEILAGIQMDQAETQSDILVNQATAQANINKQAFENAQELPLN